VIARARVRRMEARDKDAWRRLFGDYIAFYRADVPEPVIEATWRRLLSGSDGMVGLVAVGDDDRPIGLAHLVFHVSTWSPTAYCYLEDLYVDAASRGSGAGRALIAATYAEADRRGATRTYWATETGNAEARRLYDRVATLSPFVQYRR